MASKNSLMKSYKDILQWIIQPYHGSNRLSLMVWKRIERLHITQLVGIPLVTMAFFGAVVLPQARAGLDNTVLYFDKPNEVVNASVTAPTYHWPLATFGISQNFSGWHPGMDLTDPAGTPIHAVADGTVVYAGWDLSGYGRHVIVKHDDAIESLYAHMSKIDVTVGQKVIKTTQLGEVGATGHATGNHLHLEIHINGAPTNPADVLPELNKALN